PFEARRPWKGTPYHDAFPSSTYLPATGDVASAGFPGFTTGAVGASAAVEAFALSSVLAGVGVGVMGGGWLPTTGRRPAQPLIRITNGMRMNARKERFAGSVAMSTVQAEPSLRDSAPLAARRASSHPAASVSFSDTSRRNCAVRFSVS